MSGGLDVDAHVRGVLSDDRAALGRAITLVESSLPEDRDAAQELLVRLLPRTGGSVRVGISGAPGVGKSTFIEALGTRLTAEGRSVAVLAVDPSSERSGGSILGDKTRMARLAREPLAFIRPSPAAGAAGGIARATRDVLLLCEAAGYDVVLVETVGVGQGETAVAAMVDTFLLLLLAGAGDGLQGIKRGILELADLLAVTKADGENVAAAERARAVLASSLRLSRPRHPEWSPEACAISARDGVGIDALWERVLAHRAALSATGALEAQRRGQAVGWMWRAVDADLQRALRAHPASRDVAAKLEDDVREGRTTPSLAAGRILSAFVSTRR